MVDERHSVEDVGDRFLLGLDVPFSLTAGVNGNT